MSEIFDIGDTVRIKAVFTDTDTEAPLDPSTVEFKVKKPDGSILDFIFPATVTKIGVGIYQIEVDADADGTWYSRIFSTGTGKTADEDSYAVRKSLVL